MQFDLVTPEQLLISMEADYISIPGSEGSFGVLKGHQPTISTLTPGTIEVKNDKEVVFYSVGYGFADVTADKVTILAEEAISKSDIDKVDTEAKLTATLTKCEKLKKDSGSETEIKQLECKIACLEARLELANR